MDSLQTGHTIPSSNAWVPATAGLLCGSEVVKDLINNAHTMRIDLTKDPDNAYAQEAARRHEAYLKAYRERVTKKQTQASSESKRPCRQDFQLGRKQTGFRLCRKNRQHS